MSTAHAIWLGIIQGLTEFLPISSSGHLLLIPRLLHWPQDSLTFDVALNTGTFLAAFIYFFPKWWQLLTQGIIARRPKELRLIGYLLVATLPAALIGFAVQKWFADSLRQPILTAILLIVFAFVLWWAEATATLKKKMDNLSWRDSLIVGVAQCLALIPGVSRSGITMTAGLNMGLEKAEAAEFSFLLLAPISFGAAIVELPKVVHASDRGAMLIGALVSFLVGMAAIHLLLTWLKKYGFKPYVWYRIAAGIVFLALILAGK
jgi:undecaprenyl-diphosphatase